MSTLAALFPGQGSQYVGMAQHLDDDSLTPFWNTVESQLGPDFAQLMFQGPQETLTSTENAQAALFIHSVLLLEKIKTIAPDIKFEMVLGHSIGEYAALYAAGCFTFADGLTLVRTRGLAMREAGEQNSGTMMAVLKLDYSTLENLCQEVSTETSLVVPANFNGSGQIVVSGNNDAIDRLEERIKSEHANSARTIRLQVSAAFHSPLMKSAEEKMSQALNAISFSAPQVAYVANCNGEVYAPGCDVAGIKERLTQQICANVLWAPSLTHLPEQSICLEVGAGKTLKGLMKRERSDISCYTTDKSQDLTKVIEAIR